MATDDDKAAAAKLVVGLIDPPFGGGIEEWRKFKAEMEKLSQTPEVHDFIVEADREIAAIEAGHPRTKEAAREVTKSAIEAALQMGRDQVAEGNIDRVLEILHQFKTYAERDAFIEGYIRAQARR